MVVEQSKNGEVYFTCEECGFSYKERAWAQKCQDWCAKHHSCSLEITRYAVKV